MILPFIWLVKSRNDIITPGLFSVGGLLRQGLKEKKNTQYLRLNTLAIVGYAVKVTCAHRHLPKEGVFP